MYKIGVPARSPSWSDHCIPSKVATLPLGPTATQKVDDAHETAVSLMVAVPPPMATGVDHDGPLDTLAIPSLLTAAQKVTVGQEISTNAVGDAMEPWLDQDRPLNRSPSPDAVRATHDLADEQDTETRVVPPVTLVGVDHRFPRRDRAEPFSSTAMHIAVDGQETE
jgi:hypothetical protein